MGARRWLKAASLGAACALGVLAGCGQDAAPPDPGSAEAGAPNDEASTAGPARPGPHAQALCESLDGAQVAALVGAHPTAQFYGTDDASAAGCQFSGTDGRTLTVNLAYGPREKGSVSTLFDDNRKTLENAGHAIESEPGLADAAFWQPDPGVLHARAGDCYFTAHASPSSPDLRAGLRGLIRTALPAVCPAQ